jgi:serine/threonine protein phosphatase PrpC
MPEMPILLTGMRIRHAERTDVGRVREHNEDHSLADPDLRLFVVADGMGGRAAGEVASQLAVAAVRDHVTQGRAILDAFARGGGATATDVAQLLTQSAIAATQRVFAAAQEEETRRGMGTTLTTLLLAGDRAFVAHVGDSRAALLRGGRAYQLTRDHSLIDELILSGHITREESRSPELDRLRCVLARAVGVSNEVAVDVLDLEILPGDQFLLCSDGLCQYVQGEEIAALLSGGIEAAADRLVEMACERGGHDNITVVAVRLESSHPADAERLRLFDRKATALATIPMFRDLSPHEHMHVALAAETIEAAPGTILVREDQPVPALFILLEGRIRLAREGSPGGEVGPGGWFGDASLVDRWVSAPTALAVEPARLVRVTRDSLVAVSRREPEIASKVVSGFARSAAERLRPLPARAPR